MRLFAFYIAAIRISHGCAAREAMFSYRHRARASVLNFFDLIIRWFVVVPDIYGSGAATCFPIAFLFCFFFAGNGEGC